jgi:hypothetical protein
MLIIKIKGGLGNQLFQYATARSLAIKLNTSLLIDDTFFNKDKFKGIYRLNQYKLDLKYAGEKQIKRLKNKANPNLFHKGLNILGVHSQFYKLSHWRERDLDSFYRREKHVNYDIFLEGWLAKHKYFQAIRNILTKEITPSKVSDQSLNWANKISESNSVSLHIRRGDYLSNSYFHNLSISYYLKAINYIIRNISSPVFLFFLMI